MLAICESFYLGLTRLVRAGLWATDDALDPLGLRKEPKTNHPITSFNFNRKVHTHKKQIS